LEYGQLKNFVGIWTMTKFCWNIDNDKILLEYSQWKKFIGKWTTKKCCWKKDNEKKLLEYGQRQNVVGIRTIKKIVGLWTMTKVIDKVDALSF
jgi:hypothetical protein